MASLFDIETETGCWTWRGGRHSDGSPWQAGKSAGTVEWENVYGALPRTSRSTPLRRLCGNRDCVAPSHRILRYPEAFWKRIGRRPAELQAASVFLRTMGDEALGVSWALGRWDLPAERVAWLANKLRGDRLTILAAYAVVARDALDIPDPAANERALGVVKAAQQALSDRGPA